MVERFVKKSRHIIKKLLYGLLVHMIFIHVFLKVYHSADSPANAIVRSFVRDKLSKTCE